MRGVGRRATSPPRPTGRPLRGPAWIRSPPAGPRTAPRGRWPRS
ncbi:hypothetical protein ACFFX0_07325 [Citricoccus parietis]|uniref:Uncharacterized protein n=1 Tax=Citricoccus parietis TaxID=592307 RepID=A0ABV5FWE0_9MICC